ncbi:MAG: iron-containing alcohol dehydrogenase [Burkholderiaceae bacterium]|jgi:maleylacetate reductase|nr:iron-containing alcohol dehydrogenase [Burkholderiaceae bacterium]MEB2317462.1 iron-containing alcohol dehydrogenase [Pseudomonadota bacterium]
MHAGIHRALAQPRIYQAVPLASAIAAEIDTCGAGRVFVTTTRSLTDGRLVAAAIDALGSRFAGKFDAIPAHSPRESVIAGAQQVRAAGADRILAIGGGSVIDASKVMLQALWYGIDAVDGLNAIVNGRHRGGHRPDDWQRDPQALRMIAVPTTLSAAEFSHRAGVTDVSTGHKLGFAHPLAAPEAVILDPAATLDTPMRLLLSTGVRSIDHAVERWCAARTVPYSDAMAYKALAMLLDALPRIHADPADLEARHAAQIAMWLSMLPGATDVPMGASHGIGYILGGAYGVPHGITSCVMLPAVLEWNVTVDEGRQQAIATLLGAAGEPAGPALRAFLAGLGLPVRLREIGIDEAQLPAMAERYDGTGPIRTNPRPVAGPEDVLEILRLAW